MRMSRATSRRSAPARGDKRAGPAGTASRAGTAFLLAGLVIGLALWLAGCAGGGNSDRPTPEASGDRTGSTATGSRDTTDTTDEAGAASTRPPRTTAEPPASTRPPSTTEEPPRSDTTRTTQAAPASTSPKTTAEALAPTSTTSSAAGTPASAESGGLGTLGWILLVVLVVVVVAAWLIARSRRRSAWDAEAAELERNTRNATSAQLAMVLTAETAGQRALSWPPLRAELIDLARRWDLLAGRASDDRRRDRSAQIRGLLQELVAAVDAENEALATGRDWRLLRPRVDQATQALSAVLAGVPGQEPPAGGPAGPPGPGA
jgi:hypothetical protein